MESLYRRGRLYPLAAENSTHGRMMACSYLSTTSVKPDATTSCWNPPYAGQPSHSFRPAPETSTMEPALDLTTSLKPRKPASDDDSE
ncbi:unnamed protein product [Colias eurytheme]|nr:unnamed protein product [Colias eurytheme]